MTAQMCILLISPVFSHVFGPLPLPSHAHPRQRQPSLTAGVARKGCPILGATKDIMDRGPQQGSSHCRDAVSHQSPQPRQLNPLTAPCLWIPFSGSPVPGQTGVGPETIPSMFCISWKANHSMEKSKITSTTKILLEQQRKTRGCLAVCKKLRCYEDCSPVLWKEILLPLSLLAASCKWISGLCLLTEWIRCHKHKPRAYPRTWWGCHAPWRWITALFQQGLDPAQPAFPQEQLHTPHMPEISRICLHANKCGSSSGLARHPKHIGTAIICPFTNMFS